MVFDEAGHRGGDDFSELNAEVIGDFTKDFFESNGSRADDADGLVFVVVCGDISAEEEHQAIVNNFISVFVVEVFSKEKPVFGE